MQNCKPLKHNVLVKALDVYNPTLTGDATLMTYLKTSIPPGHLMGTVEAVGELVVDIKVGDVVLFQNDNLRTCYAIQEVLIPEDLIMAKLGE